MSLAEPASSTMRVTAERLGSSGPAQRWPISYRSITAIAIISDVLIILAAGVATQLFYNIGEFGVSGEVLHHIASSAVVSVLFVSLMKSRGLYSPAELLALKNQVISIATSWSSVFLFLAGTAFALKVSEHFSRVSIFAFGVLGFAFMAAQRMGYRYLLSQGLSGQKFSGRSAVLVTDTPALANSSLVQNLLTHGFQLDKQFVLPTRETECLDTVVAEIIGYVRGSRIQEVIVGADAQLWPDLDRLLAALRVLPLPISLIPVGSASDILSRPITVVGDSVCIELHRGPLDAFERFLKRSMDIIAALFGLLLLLPLFAMASVLIKLDSSGPILFRQKRLGFNGCPFQIIKFRTMSVLEDGPTICQATKLDSRVTRVGRWLRRTSIDELPQLLNILDGSMSLVGPRPHAVAHDTHFDKLVRNYAFRQHVKPGLTGWAQVNGHRGPTPTIADIRQRVDYDLWYIDNWSLRLDFLIVFRTMFELIKGRNAY